MPRSSDGSVSAIRSALKKRLLEPQQPLGFDTERKQVFDLIEATARFGESNSALLIGPASVGKTTLVNSVLDELENSEHFESSAILVRLDGLVHVDDRTALKAITVQMGLENCVDGKVFGSFAENLAFLLASLRSGQRDRTKSVVFVLEAFDLFCAHHNQTLLYNLFDISQSAHTPICVLGVTRRLDVIELFEKRVKSRFSHRQIFLFPPDASCDVDSKIARINDLLRVDDSNWNASIDRLTKDAALRSCVQRLCDIDTSEKALRQILVLLVSRLTDDKPRLTVADFESQIARFQTDDLTHVVQDLNVLELCLVIAMKHHVDVYDEAFNFEMILTRYTKFINSNSSVQAVPRPVILKAFEHLQNLELIELTASGSSRLQKEYQAHRLTVMPQQIARAVQTAHGLPTEVVQWARSSLA